MSTRGDSRVWLSPTICPVCGKGFYPVQRHAYKDPRNRAKLVCTYPCLLEAYRLQEANRKKRGAKPRKEVADNG